MVKYPFNGQLNPNEVFASIFNQIISQQVMQPDLADNYGSLVNKFKVDGTLYGDTKLFYDVDVLQSKPWLGDAEAANLLNVNRPADPECQAITLDQFRMVDITVDNYLSKRAWSSEGVFSTFNSTILAMLGKTKKIHEDTMFLSYVGTTEGEASRSDVEVDLTTATTGLTGEEKARVEAQVIAQSIADLLVDMKDYSRDFNDFEFLRSYNEGQLKFIWSSKWINKITKLDLPTIFHKDGLMEKMDQDVIPARYFGNTVTDVTDADYSDYFAETSVGSGIYTVKSGVTVVRSLAEIDIEKADHSGRKHLFPGDIIPATYVVKGETVEGYEYDYSGNVYIENEDIICKIVTNDTFKYMSAFEVNSNFYNNRSLTENHYLIWGFSKPDRLLGQPLVTVHAD